MSKRKGQYLTGKYRVRVVVSGETLAWTTLDGSIKDLEEFLRRSCDDALSLIFHREPVTIESLKISEIPDSGIDVPAPKFKVGDRVRVVAGNPRTP